MSKERIMQTNCENCPKVWRPYVCQDVLLSLYEKYYEVSPESYSEKLLAIANNGLKSFIGSETSWDHPFDYEACEYPGSEDCEASVLSKLIFFNLFSVMKKYVANSGELGLYETFDFEAHCSRGEATYGQTSLGGREGERQGTLSFHFDVMNNPNCARNSSRIGAMAKGKDGITLHFRGIYHTIGNFTPLPWWIPNQSYPNAKYENLQAKHNHFAEWWDILLLFLQQKMPECPMSFRNYLILTCQFFYVDMNACVKACKNITKEEKKACQWLRKFQTGEGWTLQECESDFDWSGIKWESLVSNWSSVLRKMRDDADIPVLSLMDAGPECRGTVRKAKFPRSWGKGFIKGSDFFLSSTQAVKKEKEEGMEPDDIWGTTWSSHRWFKDAGPAEVRETDSLICRLIEARGRCIIGLLRGCKTPPFHEGLT